MMRDSDPQRLATKEFIVERVFAAPKELLFQAWTRLDQLQEWWGPAGFAWVEGKLDLREGGTFHYGLRSPAGSVMWGKFVYREVHPSTKLSFVVSFSDEKGGISRHPLSLTWPREILSTLTFADCEGGSVLRMRGEPVNADEDERMTFERGLDGMSDGWRGTMNQLDEHLARVVADFRRSSERELTLIRNIHASRVDVFRAFVTTDQLAQWWGPRGFTCPRCEIDAQKFGSIRIDMRAPDGQIYPMSGTFLEISEPQKLVFMSAALGADGKPLFKIHNTLLFVEKNDMTILEMRAVVSSALPEAAPYLAGMEEGLSQTIDRLNEFVSRK
jgi:uncharacterized protein YndB with AHSA1/START domain